MSDVKTVYDGSGLLTGAYRLTSNPTPELRLLAVTLHHEIEGWWADSGLLSGFSAAGANYDELTEVLNGAAQEHGYDGWIGIMPPEPTMEVPDESDVEER